MSTTGRWPRELFLVRHGERAGNVTRALVESRGDATAARRLASGGPEVGHLAREPVPEPPAALDTLRIRPRA